MNSPPARRFLLHRSRWEVIFVDDGSTQLRFEVEKTCQNQGIDSFLSRNFGHHSRSPASTTRWGCGGRDDAVCKILLRWSWKCLPGFEKDTTSSMPFAHAERDLLSTWNCSLYRLFKDDGPSTSRRLLFLMSRRVPSPCASARTVASYAAWSLGLGFSDHGQLPKADSRWNYPLKKC